MRPEIARANARYRGRGTGAELPKVPAPPEPPPHPELPEIAEALVVRPGDTLIVRFDRTFSAVEAQRVKDKLGERLPGVDVLVIGCQQLAVYRPEPTS